MPGIGAEDDPADAFRHRGDEGVGGADLVDASGRGAAYARLPSRDAKQVAGAQAILRKERLAPHSGEHGVDGADIGAPLPRLDDHDRRDAEQLADAAERGDVATGRRGVALGGDHPAGVDRDEEERSPTRLTPRRGTDARPPRRPSSSTPPAPAPRPRCTAPAPRG